MKEIPTKETTTSLTTVVHGCQKKVLLPSSHILFWTMESWEESSLWKARGIAMKNSLTRNVTPYHLLLNLHLRNPLLFIVITPLWKKKLEEDHRYKKRVSSLAKDGVNGLRDISIVEYIGKFPGLSTHGNQKRTENKYVRTQAEVMDNISDMLKQNLKPKKVYNRLVQEHEELRAPNKPRQIHDKKRRDEKKQERERNTRLILRIISLICKAVLPQMTLL